MEQTKTTTTETVISKSSTVEEIEKEANKLYHSLPKEMEGTFLELCFCRGVWFPTGLVPLRSLLLFEKCFQTQDPDILIVSAPKCGTTWVKALTFSIVNRTRYSSLDTPLLTTNPHNLVPFLDPHLIDVEIRDTTIPSPRLFATHLPYSVLSESIKHSHCKIVYIGRNPFDSAVSIWHHYREIQADFDMPLEEYVEEYYFKGISWFGPYWDHVLGFWKESLENPNKVLFLTYEDMKGDTISSLKRLAEFIGYPFSKEEERDGGIQEIKNLCSLNNLQNLEVNKSGMFLEKMPNKAFFRRGTIGDGIKLLSPAMKKKLQNMMEEKLKGSGLSF